MKTILITISVLIAINSKAQTTKDTNNIKDCDYKIYYQANGNKEKEGCLVKGSKEGIWKEYTESGWGFNIYFQ
jgi:antitoxin component YwqK of YwqJK toxin-antitoxin module